MIPKGEDLTVGCIGVRLFQSEGLVLLELASMCAMMSMEDMCEWTSDLCV